jgi:hypothetical protein
MAAPSFPPPIGRRPSIEWVPLDELQIDAAYQRSVEFAASKRHIRKIAEGWDWTLFGMLLVSRRPDDRLFVVDGQHRLEGARLRGDIDMVPCSISRRSGPEEEAKLFIAANRTRRTVATIDDYHAALAAGDPDTVRLNGLIEGAGLKVARHYDAKGYGPGELGFIAGLRRAVQKHGEPPIAAALTQLGEAFPDETLVNGGAILSALIDLQVGYELDQDALFQTLLEKTTAEWSQAAKLGALTGGKQRIDAVKNAILARYRAHSARAAA